MHRATPKQALKLYSLIQSDNFLANEGTQYVNVHSTKVLSDNLRYRTSTLYCEKNPISTYTSQNLPACVRSPITGTSLLTNSDINNIKHVQYLMRRGFHWQYWKQNVNGGKNAWKLAGRLLGIGAFASAVYALLQLFGILPQKKPMGKHPAKSNDIPDEIEYLLVGGGTAAFAASRAIKGRHATAKVLIISKEPYYPYMKPPLSKELLFNQNREMAENLRFPQWSGTVRSIFYESDKFYTPCKELDVTETGGVAVARGWKVVAIDAYKKTVTLEDGKTIKYGKCLLATGSTPTKLKMVEDQPDKIKERISYYNNLTHFQKIDEIVKNGAKAIAIYGNGLLCCELACALALRGKSSGLNVIIIMPTMRLMQDTFPPYLCDWLRRRVEAVGVTVVANYEIKRFLIGENNMLNIPVGQKRHLEVDHLIVCTASKANTEIAEESHLEVDSHLGGFIVNSELAVSSHLYAAGDCASYYDVLYRRRRNLLQYDHAVVTGRIAGENMTGAEKPLQHEAMLWSELGANVGFESVGVLDSDLKTVGFFLQPDDPKAATIIVDTEHYQTPPRYCHKGVVFYLKNQHIEGIVMWNLYNRLDVARQVLAEKRHYTDLREIAKLFELYKD